MTEAWMIVRKGEKRIPVEGEYYLLHGDKIESICKCYEKGSAVPHPILSVTPIPSREEAYEAWAKYWKECFPEGEGRESLYHKSGWLTCYDNLFPQPKQSSYPSLKARVKELEEKQKWIDGVGRPDHPDDERPWASEYLNAKCRIKQLEEAIKTHKRRNGLSIGSKKNFPDFDKELYAVLSPL